MLDRIVPCLVCDYIPDEITDHVVDRPLLCKR